ncbi:hypothetical protein [Gordonia alkanivorans]|uniref:Mu-like prophage I protein n=1 Tax=Gordonia alkanivorans NBRC 16433 TaxID=1027371 RepID=F9VVE1_9ACTN|nr:hypothetical protein [Gordonia alkanivorans]GAA12570.1 hypothetical protein GOALK_056_00030 [Gordonia alkanivorans NBRC 16433]
MAPKTKTRKAAAPATPPPADQAVEPVDPPEIDGEEWASLLGALGLTSDATFDTVLTTVTDLVTDEAATDGAPAAIAAAAGRRGLVVMDEATADALKTAAAEGAQVKLAAAEQHREQVILAAIKRGAITRGRSDHWRTLLEHDPGMETVLAKIPDETAIPMKEIGHGVDNQDLSNSEPGSTWFR